MNDKKTLSAAIALILTQTVYAQSNDDSVDDFSTLDTITVVGEGVERSVFDTSSSIVVFDEEALQRNPSKRSIKEVITEAANVYASSSVGSPTIRGQDTQGPNYGAGAFFSGTVPRVGINIDGRVGDYNELYFGSQSLWDVEQIEVLRGPQTTTQGANNIAGAIIVKTKDPTFSPEFSGEALYGSRNKVSIGAAVSGPLVTDELAGRVAFSYNKRDTFVNYSNPDFDPGDANLGIENKNLRAKLLWTPTAIPQLEAKLTLNHSESEGPQQEIVNAPFADQANVATSIVSWPIKSTAAIADVRYDFSDNYYVNTRLQASKSHAKRILNPMTSGSADIEKRDISNETRFHFSSEDERIKGFVGFYLRRTDADEYLNLRGDTDFDDEKKQVGVFSELGYQFTPQWTLTGSLRYQNDHIERHGSSDLLGGASLDYSQTFTEWLPKLALSYQVNDNALIGASVSKGYNPGGIGLSFRQRAFVPFEKETAWTYELFTRADLLDDRLSINANLFYSDFDNAQRNVVTTLSNGLIEALSINAEDAKSYGMELGADWAVSDTLNLHGSVGLLHTEIGRFTHAQQDYVGKTFAKSPNHSINIGADWQFRPDWRLSGNIRHVGSYYSDDANTDAYRIDDFTVANAKFSYQPSDNVEIFAYVNNLFDADSPTWINNDARGNGLMANIIEPREFGIGVRASW